MAKNEGTKFVGTGSARFGEPVPGADELKLQAAWLEQQAAAYQALAETAKKAETKKVKDK